MRRLYEARDRIEAQFLRDLLERHCISATVLGDFLAGAAGELPVNIFPAVWILEDADWPRAHELLLQFQAGASSTDGDPWVCPGCGEEVAGEFDLCWNCGRERT